MPTNFWPIRLFGIDLFDLVLLNTSIDYYLVAGSVGAVVPLSVLLYMPFVVGFESIDIDIGIVGSVVFISTLGVVVDMVVVSVVVSVVVNEGRMAQVKAMITKTAIAILQYIPA